MNVCSSELLNVLNSVCFIIFLHVLGFINHNFAGDYSLKLDTMPHFLARHNSSYLYA